jgi:hypothetical protein
MLIGRAIHCYALTMYYMLCTPEYSWWPPGEDRELLDDLSSKMGVWETTNSFVVA